METKVETLEDNNVKVSVTVDAQEVDDRIAREYKNIANKYNFPGFRKGKAPRPVIDNALGKEAILATVTDDVVNNAYPLAIEEIRIYPIAKPQFDDPELVEGGKPFEFTFTVEVKPEVELSSYEPVAIELPVQQATDKEIETQIEALREHYYTLEDTPANTKVKADSYVDISMKATDDAGEEIASLTAEDRPYGLGSGLFPTEFDEQLIGHKKGESVSFTLDMPEEPTLLLSALKGKTDKINFEIEVKAVKKNVLPELTDEWVKETLGFENVADLRERVAETITQQKEDIMPRLKEGSCLAQLQEHFEGEVPAVMKEEAETNLLQDFFRQLQAQGMSFDMYLMSQGITADQFKEDLKKQAEDITAQDLALDAWAKHFGIEATDEDVTAEFAKTGVEDPAALQDEWLHNGQLHLVRQGVLRAKAVENLMDSAVVTEVEDMTEEKPEKKSKKSSKKAKQDKEAESEEEN